MRIEITARHFEAPDALKQYAEKEVSSLTKFYDGIVDCHIILERDGSGETAELRIGVYGRNLVARDTSDEMARSIDGVVQKLRRQLKRYKRQLRRFAPGDAVRH